MNRRHILHAGISASLGSVFSATGGLAKPKNLDELSFIRLAVATICTDGFGNQHHEPAFKLIPQLGVRNVEFNLWYDDLLTPAYWDSLLKRCQDTGLTPVCVQGSGFGAAGAEGLKQDWAHKWKLLQAAKRLGCRRVKCTGSKRGTKGGLASVIAVCKELAPAFEEAGALLLLENHANNVLENIADYDTIFEQIDSPNVGLCLDTGHFEGAGIQLADVVERFHSRTLHIDLKDCKAFGKGHDTVVFGEGVTDFTAFLDLVTRRNFHGYMVLEQAWAEPREPIVENLRKGVAMFRKFERG